MAQITPFARLLEVTFIYLINILSASTLSTWWCNRSLKEIHSFAQALMVLFVQNGSCQLHFVHVADTVMHEMHVHNLAVADVWLLYRLVFNYQNLILKACLCKFFAFHWSLFLSSWRTYGFWYASVWALIQVMWAASVNVRVYFGCPNIVVKVSTGHFYLVSSILFLLNIDLSICRLRNQHQPLI